MGRQDNENIKFGRRITELRLRQGVSQENLAFQSGINRTYMGEIERGEKSPTLATIAKIAKGLGLTIKQVMDYE